MRKLRTAGVSAFGAFIVLACGGEPDVVQKDPGKGGMGAEGGEGATSGSNTGGSGAIINNGGTAGDSATGGSSGKGGASGKGGKGGTTGDPCDGVECGQGTHCVDGDCDDNTDCDDDLDCTDAKYCKNGTCTDDDCTPDTRSCMGNSVVTCNSNGSANPGVACDGGGYFTSTCTDTGAGNAGCGCEDDWDCPEFMVCDVNVCTGTGVAPTCTLPPVPFTSVLPQIEFRWGGTSHEFDNNGAGDDNTTGTDNATDDADDDATGKAFPWSAQVVSTPIVINLDDDNGDGKADERDFPEVVFLSHHETQRDTNGIVRAVHGGGPNKGQDYFALCGNPARPAMSMTSYTDASGAYWGEGAAVITDCATDGDAESRNDALARSSSTLAAGDLDGDGFPEIIVSLEDKSFMILNNRGEALFKSPADVTEPAGGTFYVSPSPAIANLDFTGLPELIFGNRVISLTKTGGAFAIDKVYSGSLARGTQDQSNFINGPTVCVADLTADAGLEIVAGPTAYKLPASPTGTCTAAMPCPLDVVWNARTALAAEQAEGLCAIADILGGCTSVADCASNPPGPGHPLDGKPEVVLIANGHLVILDGPTGTVLVNQQVSNGGQRGGAPNIDDFDGDGFPEVATALENFYTVIDLQAPTSACPSWPNLLDARNAPPQTNPPRAAASACTRDSDCTTPGMTCNETSGECVCLHNGWMRDTEDDSSRVTSSSVFDFNGDGAAEVVYNDECYFRVYDGSTGNVYLALPSVSRTIIENPVVADVDNDGNAEIVFVQNNWVEQCDEGGGWSGGGALDGWPNGMDDVRKDSLPNGIEVWGDPTDTWVAARRVWNEHAYHVTNVLEGGGIPTHEPESWKPLNGRLYNTYRSQPRNYGVAPDLTIPSIQVSSPDAVCGELSNRIQITVLVKNQGDLRVGPGVPVEFLGAWPGEAYEPLLDRNGDPIVVTLTKSLEPGASTLITVEYRVGWNDAPHDTSLPERVRARVDGNDMERECIEDNNEARIRVEATGVMLADLAVSVDAAACNGTITVTVENQGSAPASDILVEIYTGDPSSGGTKVGEVTIAGPLAPGESDSATTDVLSSGSFPTDVTIWVVADPNDDIAECNDANNVAEGPMLDCQSDPH